MTDERRPLHVSRVEANAIYEGLTLLSMFAAKSKHPERLPYSSALADELRARVIDEAWPSLAEVHRPNRKERRHAG